MLTDLEKLAYQSGGAGWREMVDDMLKNGYAPPGYRLVPEVPTEEMAEAFCKKLDEKLKTSFSDLWWVEEGYRAMLDAAPGTGGRDELG